MASIRDNREILRFRGLQSPSEVLQSQQNADIKTAILRLSRLRADLSVAYVSNSESARETPFMRLLPAETSDDIYDFYFPYTPQNISFSELSDEVVEIPRAGTTPIVAFKSHRLMKVSFEFLVAVPYDGLLIDVERSLKILRLFSTSSHRSVQFFHLDELLMGGWRYRNGTANVAPNFNIVEMSITARQRNSLGKITQAVVNVTLVENQNPNIAVVRIPPFRKKPPKKTSTRPRQDKPKSNTVIPMSQWIDQTLKNLQQDNDRPQTIEEFLNQ